MTDKRQKNIAFVTTNVHVRYGGSEVLWSLAAERMARSKTATVSVLIPQWEPLPAHVLRIQEAGGRILFWPKEDFRGLSRFQSMANRLLPYRNQFKHGPVRSPLEVLEGISPDLVVLSCGNLLEGASYGQWLKNQGFPYLSLIQLVAELHYPLDREAEPVIDFYRHAAANCFVSENNLHLLERMLAMKIPRSRIVFNPAGYDRMDIPPCPPMDQIVRLACPGRYHTLHKGQDLLFEVLRLDKWKGRPLEVDCYGEGPSFLQLVRLRNLWQLDKVAIHPHTDDIPSVWERHHGIIQPSRMEGFSVALVEAMTAARLPIATAVGGAQELIDDGVNGFLAAAPTVPGIDDALERAWVRRQEWPAMGVLAQQRISKLFRNNPVDDFIEVIMKAATTGPGGG